MANNNTFSGFWNRFQSTMSTYPHMSLKVIHFIESSSRSLSSFFKNIEEMAEDQRRSLASRTSDKDATNTTNSSTASTAKNASGKRSQRSTISGAGIHNGTAGEGFTQ